MLRRLRNLLMVPPVERALSRLTAGRPVSSLPGRMVPNYLDYPPGTVRQFTRHGITMEVDLSDFMGYMAYFGFAEEETFDYLSLITPGATVLDIGANIGRTVLRAAVAVGPLGRVVGFEPDPLNFSRLQRNISLNPYTNIRLMPVGLGPQNTELKLFVSSGSNRGGNRIAESGSGEYSVVPVRRLDELSDELRLDRVDLIKIDVEGFELNVLRGARALLQQFRPVLFLEVNEHFLNLQGDSGRELILFLKELGYQRFTRTDIYEKVDADYKFDNCHFDLTCAP